MLSKVTRTAGALAVMSTIGACSGGGGSSSPAQTSAPTGPTPVTASGVITGFSSVFVNGSRYEVAGDTVVAIDGDGEFVGDDSRLKVGMKVRIRASRDDDADPVAERIEYDDDFKGPARNVMPSAENPALGSFGVLGQTVLVDGNTAFDDDVGDNDGDANIDIRDLTLPGGGELVVEVSGLPTADGILATRIDRVDAAGVPGTPDDEFEIKGFVDAVAEDGSSFDINGATFLVVAGAGGTEFEDGLRADASLVGVFVEVEADENGAGELIAVEVGREDDYDDDRDREFEVEGILLSVDTVADPDVVVIDGLTLQVNDASSLVGREGSRVELEGVFDANGVLMLREFKLEVENTVRIEDRVVSVDPAGTVTTRLGVDIVPTGDSRVEDDTAEDDDADRLTPSGFLDRVMIGGFIEARGYPNADRTVTWRRIELEDEDDQACELRGPVESIEGTSSASFSFVIQGVTIDVSQILSDDGFEGDDDADLGRQAFFDNLEVGDVVEAESDEQGVGCQTGTLTAREVAFEDDDDIVGSSRGDDDGAGADQLVGTPTAVGIGSFVLGERTIRVVGSTLIDDSIIERALGREFDGDDRRFDQLPEGLTLPDLLTGDFPVEVRVGADGVALLVEDL